MAPVDTATENDEVARRWTEEVLNRRNAAAVDELVAPNYELHPLFYNAYVPKSIQGGSWVERMKQNIDKDILGLEDRHTTIDQTISAGDKVVIVTTTTGTRNGKQISYSSVSIVRLADGKIVETWGLWDRLGVYQQLGIVPETPELMRQAGLET